VYRAAIAVCVPSAVARESGGSRGKGKASRTAVKKPNEETEFTKPRSTPCFNNDDGGDDDDERKGKDLSDLHSNVSQKATFLLACCVHKRNRGFDKILFVAP